MHLNVFTVHEKTCRKFIILPYKSIIHMLINKLMIYTMFDSHRCDNRHDNRIFIRSSTAKFHMKYSQARIQMTQPQSRHSIIDKFGLLEIDFSSYDCQLLPIARTYIPILFSASLCRSHSRVIYIQFSRISNRYTLLLKTSSIDPCPKQKCESLLAN